MPAVTGKHHQKERRKAERRLERKVAKHLTQPLPPLSQPDLTFFEAWYDLAVVEGLTRLTWQRGAQEEGWKKDLASILHWQKIYTLDLAEIKYLHSSALAMCEAILPPDGDQPSVREPWKAKWLQPLASLRFRDQQVRGVLLYKPYNLTDFDHNPHFARMTPQARSFWHEFFSDLAPILSVEIVTYDELPPASSAGAEVNDIRRSRTYRFAEWDGSSWKRIGDECLTGACQVELIGEAQERILCPACQEELDHWTRWIKGFLWILEGKFRHAHDTAPAPVHEQVVEVHPAIASQKRRTSYRGEIVRFDSSYFRAPTQRPGVPLLAAHSIVSSEEAESLGEVDAENILIEDFTDVGGYKRTLRDKRYYPEGKVPAREEDLRRVDVRGKEHKRVYISVARWRAREEQRSKRRKQTLVYASDYTAGVQ
jgi:hypothetical protein